jgi:hypothetical protein
MHQQQQAGFAQQSAYSQQISSQMPQPYGGFQNGGLGSMGFQGGAAPGGGYSYAPSGYGPANDFGTKMASGIFGMGHAAGGMLGIGGGLLGFKMGGVPGALIGGGLGILGAGASHVFNSMGAGVAKDAAIDRTLSQFQFMNASSQSGKGFDRNASRAISQMVTQMERMPEMLTSFGELNRIMDKMGQMGLMQGVTDAGQFQTKFRETIKTLKSVSKIIGGTMEEALVALGESRRAGFYSSSDILKNVVNRQVLTSTTGMNQQQLSQLQQYGAEMGHATGGSRAGGARNITRMAGQIGFMNQQGKLSSDEIFEMTGKEGAAGVQDLAANMSDLSYRMAQKTPGTVATLALGEVKDGRFTGKMDEDLVARYRAGEFGLDELKRMARQKASTRGAKLSFRAHEKRLRSEMAGAVGAEGQARWLKEILGERGWENPDAINLVMQKFGATEEQANLLQKMMPNLSNLDAEMGRAGKQEARRSASQSIMKERHSLDAIKKKLVTKIKHYTTDWAEDIGKGVKNYFQNWADDFTDDLQGNYKEVLTKSLANDLVAASGGSRAAAARLTTSRARAGAAAGGLGGNALDVGKSGGLSGLGTRFLSWAGGSYSQGQQIAGMLGGLDQGQYLTESEGSSFLNPFGSSGRDKALARGDTVLDSSAWSGNAKVLTQENQKKAAARLKSLADESAGGGGMKEYQKFSAVLGAQGMDSLTMAFRSAMRSGGIENETDSAKRTELILSKMGSSMEAYGEGGTFNTAKMIGGVNLLAAIQAKEASQGRNYVNKLSIGGAGGLLGGLPLGNQIAVGDALKKTERDLSGRMKGGEGKFSWSELKGVLDKGGALSQMIVGTESMGGISASIMDAGEMNRRMKMGATFEEASGTAMKEALEQVYAAGPTGKVDKKTEEFLAKQGWTASDLYKQIEDAGPGFMEKLRNLPSQATAGDLLKYVSLTEASGLNKVSKEIRTLGEEQAAHLTKSTEDVETLTKSGGSDLVELMKKQAESLTKTDWSKSEEELTAAGGMSAQKLAETDVTIAERVSKLDKGSKERRAAEKLMDPATRATMEAMEDSRRKLKKVEGKGIDEVLGAMGIDRKSVV